MRIFEPLITFFRLTPHMDYNEFAPIKCGCYFGCVIFKHIMIIYVMIVCDEIVLMWMPQHRNEENWTLSHYWPVDAPDSRVHGANMWPIWVRQNPGGPMLAPRTLLSGANQQDITCASSTMAYDVFSNSVATGSFSAKNFSWKTPMYDQNPA